MFEILDGSLNQQPDNHESNQDSQETLNWHIFDDMEEPHPDTSPAISDTERLEQRLRGKLTEAGNDFVRREKMSYSILSDELSHEQGTRRFAEPVFELGMGMAQYDTKRFDALAGFIDYQFSHNDAPSPDRRTPDDYREECFRATNARAGIIDESIRSLIHASSQIDDQRLENITDCLKHLDQTIPDGQSRLMKDYFTYFENPTEQNKRKLTDSITEYTESFRRGLHDLSEEVANHHLGNGNLAGAINFGLGRSITDSYNGLHKAIMEYYHHKLDESKSAPAPRLSDTVPTKSASSSADDSLANFML